MEDRTVSSRVPGRRRTPPLAPLLLVLSLPAWGQAAAEEFRFLRLNRAYVSFLPEMAPVELGGVTIRLTSPEHALSLHNHRAVVRPDGSGNHRTTLEIELSGRGVIAADILLGKVEGHVQDEVEVPSQTLLLHGHIDILSLDGGYLITPLSIDEDEVTVEIRSGLGVRLSFICRQLPLILVKMDCGALEEAVSRVRIPLDLVGETYLLRHDELSDAEREALDAYLSPPLH